MAIKVKQAVLFGFSLLPLLAIAACNRDAAPNAGVSEVDKTTSGQSVTPAPDATTLSPNSSGSSSNLNSAFPISPTTESAKVDTSTASKANVPIQVVDADEFQSVVDKHRGKVVLVDCWATWCGPCKEQFPHTVQLSRQYSDKGLAVISMSFDDPERQQDVADFLIKQNANFDHLISKLGAGVESFVKFGIEGGALPYYKLYDRSGKLRYQFSGDNAGLEPKVLKVDELDKRLEELLAESGN